MLGVGAVIAGAVPVALVAVDRSDVRGRLAFPNVAEQSLNVPSPLSGKAQPGLSQPLPNIHSNMLWNRSVPPPHENDGGSAPCVSAVMTASVSKPLFEPDGRALCFRDHRYFAPCVVASRW